MRFWFRIILSLEFSELHSGSYFLYLLPLSHYSLPAFPVLLNYWLQIEFPTWYASVEMFLLVLVFLTEFCMPGIWYHEWFQALELVGIMGWNWLHSCLEPGIDFAYSGLAHDYIVICGWLKERVRAIKWVLYLIVTVVMQRFMRWGCFFIT